MTSMPTTVRTPRRTGTKKNSQLDRSQWRKKARKAARKWCRQLPSEGARRAFGMLLGGSKETPLGIIIMLIERHKPTGAVRTYLYGLVDKIDRMQD